MLLFIVSIHIVKTLAGKAKAKRASDDSSEASSEDYGEDEDEEEGQYEIEEDEEELEEDGDSDGELLPALGTGASLHFGDSLTKELSFLAVLLSRAAGTYTHAVERETWQFCVYMESERVKAFAGLALTSHQSLSSLFRGLLQRGSNKLFERSPPHKTWYRSLAHGLSAGYTGAGCTSLSIGAAPGVRGAAQRNPLVAASQQLLPARFCPCLPSLAAAGADGSGACQELRLPWCCLAGFCEPLA